MNKKLTLLIAIAMAGTSGAAFAQSSASLSTTGSTQIIRAITITPGDELQFGRIVRPSSGTATVAVSAAGTRTVGGNATAAGGTVTAASYTVNGEGGQTFSISPALSFDMTNGASTLTVTTAPSATAGTLDGSLGSNGTASFTVGGSFEITSTTATGDYSGTFNVEVAYN